MQELEEVDRLLLVIRFIGTMLPGRGFPLVGSDKIPLHLRG